MPHHSGIRSQLSPRPSLQTLNNVGAALTMKRLWEVAMSTGKYDLARSNCHHVAQAVYNACVPDSHAQLQVGYGESPLRGTCI